MSTEKLTEKALEEHDLGCTKQEAAKSKRTSQSKENPGTVQSRSRQPSRSESLVFGPSDPNYYLKRQMSRSSLNTVLTRPGMSVFGIVQAARLWKRKTAVTERPKFLMENTYKLGPEPDQVFRPEKVKEAIQETLTMFLEKFTYIPEQSKRMCLNISTELKSRVKCMNFSRYKIVCHVIIMQNRGQGLNISSQCAWTPTTDSFASYTFRNEHIICVANVFAVYFE